MKTLNQRNRGQVLAAFREFLKELKASEENKERFSFIALRKKYGLSSFAYSALPSLAGQDITDDFVKAAYDVVMEYRHSTEKAYRGKPIRRFAHRIADEVKDPGRRIGKPAPAATTAPAAEPAVKPNAEKANWALVQQLRLLRFQLQTDHAALVHAIDVLERRRPGAWLRRLIAAIRGLFACKKAQKDLQMR